MSWAVGSVPPASEPALGSVRPKAPIFLPLHRSGRYLRFCSSVPNWTMGKVPREVWADKMTPAPPSTRASSSTAMA